MTCNHIGITTETGFEPESPGFLSSCWLLPYATCLGPRCNSLRSISQRKKQIFAAGSSRLCLELNLMCLTSQDTDFRTCSCCSQRLTRAADGAAEVRGTESSRHTSSSAIVSWHHLDIDSVGMYGMSGWMWGCHRHPNAQIHLVLFSLLETKDLSLNAACHGPVSVCSDLGGLQDHLLVLWNCYLTRPVQESDSVFLTSHSASPHLYMILT